MTPQEWREMCSDMMNTAYKDYEPKYYTLMQTISRGELTARKIAAKEAGKDGLYL